MRMFPYLINLNLQNRHSNLNLNLNKNKKPKINKIKISEIDKRCQRCRSVMVKNNETYCDTCCSNTFLNKFLFFMN